MVIAVSYLALYDTLLQNVADILLQNATKVNSKMSQFLYYNVYVTFITKCVGTKGNKDKGTKKKFV